MLEDIQGRKILIFGGSSGIGAAAAARFAALGAHVAIHYASGKDRAATLRDRLNAQGGKAVIVGGDLTRPGEAASVVAAAGRDLGGLDILINNAGAMVGRARLGDVERDLYDRVMDLNAWAVIEASQAALPALKESESAAIINVSSVAGRNGGGPGAGLYASAKAFVANYTRNMAKDLAEAGIRVNAISPGVIETEFHANTPSDVLASFVSGIPLGRAGKAEDCVGSLVFLASNQMSGYITGHVVDVNGGLMMV